MTAPIKSELQELYLQGSAHVRTDLNIGSRLNLGVSGSDSAVMTIRACHMATDVESGTLIIREGGLGISDTASMWSAGAVVITNTQEVLLPPPILPGLEDQYGAFVCYGGTTIARQANIGGDVKITSTTTSTATSNGALVVSGGLGVASNINVGGSVTASGDVHGSTGYFANLNIGGSLNPFPSNFYASYTAYFFGLWSGLTVDMMAIRTGNMICIKFAQELNGTVINAYPTFPVGSTTYTGTEFEAATTSKITVSFKLNGTVVIGYATVGGLANMRIYKPDETNFQVGDVVIVPIGTTLCYPIY
jgi:hypothetical protein